MAYLEVSLSDFDDIELIEDLEERGYRVFARDSHVGILLNTIYENKRNGKPYDDLLNEYLYETLGRII